VTVGNEANAGASDDRLRIALRAAAEAAVAAGAFAFAAYLTGSLDRLAAGNLALGILFPALFITFATLVCERLAFGSARAAFAAAGAAAAAALLAGFAALSPSSPWTAAQAIVAAALYLAVRLVLFGSRTGLERTPRHNKPHVQRAIVIGSKDAASAVLRSIAARADLPFDVVACLDDDTDRRSVEGVPVLGGIDRLPAVVTRLGAGCVIIASSKLSAEKIRQINEICATLSTPDGAKIVVKLMPEVADLLMGTVRVSRLRDVCLEDLLQRKGVNVDAALAAPHLRNQVVLVTGAGGSIGGEICRQIAAFEPKLLLLLGHGENSLFAIDQELRSLGFSRTRIVVADVADAALVRRVFAQFRPHLVFHAAAHKHVPIVESNICEAVRNNVLGTQVVALAAAASGVAKFVMISTDKAVNPSSMMGATKRAAEMICQSFERRTGTEFVSVRFGNVLGSRGSVIHTFKSQIERGGPVTVTHPDMVRHFMTIPEAVSLVLEAMAIGRDGQVFVMDMGEPVRVVELAENLITLSGLRPYEDIDIVFSGIRPGEKLFEEMLTARERENPTVNARLFMAQQERIEYERLSDSLGRLDLAVRTPDPATVLGLMQRLVPSYTPSPMLLAREELAPARLAKSQALPDTAPSNGSGNAAGANGVVPVDQRALAGSIDAGD
jgi:FlaA1/EpsC-like NDP-sugar epimerase